jgi:hypothetical protein
MRSRINGVVGIKAKKKAQTAVAQRKRTAQRKGTSRAKA